MKKRPPVGFDDFTDIIERDFYYYVRELLENPDAKPKSYWMNTSSNHIVKRFIDLAMENSIGRQLRSTISYYDSYEADTGEKICGSAL